MEYYLLSLFLCYIKFNFHLELQFDILADIDFMFTWKPSFPVSRTVLGFLQIFGLEVFCATKFFTINYLDQHRSFVTLHKFPGDHDEFDQNGSSRKGGKNNLRFKS